MIAFTEMGDFSLQITFHMGRIWQRRTSALAKKLQRVSHSKVSRIYGLSTAGEADITPNRRVRTFANHHQRKVSEKRLLVDCNILSDARANSFAIPMRRLSTCPVFSR